MLGVCVLCHNAFALHLRPPVGLNAYVRRLCRLHLTYV